MSQSLYGSLLDHTVCMSGCSRLQQEQLYLRQALVDEERQAERFNVLVWKFERQLSVEASNDRMKTLRRQLRNLNVRKAQSEKIISSLLEKMNLVMEQLEGLHSPTWGKAYSEYTLNTPSSGMTTATTIPHWSVNPSPLLVGTPHFWKLPTTATALPSSIVPSFVSPDRLQCIDEQLPATSIIQAISSIKNSDLLWQDYPFPHYVANHPRMDTDMVSPTDTLSPCTLGPLTPISTEMFSMDSIPGTQVFDLVNGMRAIGFDQEREHLPSDDFFPSQEPQLQPIKSQYTVTRQLNLLSGQSAAIRLERAARAIDMNSRRSI
ncbi:hypothetical protein PV10_05057 [Exophiala mesophila]|uniref:Uncharacterized protein n=1 Tax=Exophiala mesophila TaxID=212818 RepID=A0A0D2A4H9_EXOME|nr:uncharacterized protein PV10_05057 [Exophiala mesophila]KIV93878.1 hypothetical protein PV10_05057 [Exophiala mesophila]